MVKTTSLYSLGTERPTRLNADVLDFGVQILDALAAYPTTGGSPHPYVSIPFQFAQDIVDAHDGVPSEAVCRCVCTARALSVYPLQRPFALPSPGQVFEGNGVGFWIYVLHALPQYDQVTGASRCRTGYEYCVRVCRLWGRGWCLLQHATHTSLKVVMPPGERALTLRCLLSPH